METVTAQEANDNLMAMLSNASNEQCKYRITSAEGTVVMLSEESYESLLVTLEMLSSPILFNNMDEMECALIAEGAGAYITMD
ncbi:MAG: type II toxin-antitoxin system Phd/YefM family antitoxin [Parachlamydiaceae bacterium]|nr:type II toxin-antitoxin system Phd/YefM family antitoxin [Parachlamydiaceae bacterium]